MKNKPVSSEPLSPKEARLIELLREQPQMMERFQSIVALANAAEGPLKTADEVEDLLIEEVRKLGNATMREWASKAEERVTSELKAQDPTIRSRKKKR
jgi:hypothetical protein